MFNSLCENCIISRGLKYVLVKPGLHPEQQVFSSENLTVVMENGGGGHWKFY